MLAAVGGAVAIAPGAVFGASYNLNLGDEITVGENGAIISSTIGAAVGSQISRLDELYFSATGTGTNAGTLNIAQGATVVFADPSDRLHSTGPGWIVMNDNSTLIIRDRESTASGITGGAISMLDSDFIIRSPTSGAGYFGSVVIQNNHLRGANSNGGFMGIKAPNQAIESIVNDVHSILASENSVMGNGGVFYASSTTADAAFKLFTAAGTTLQNNLAGHDGGAIYVHGYGDAVCMLHEKSQGGFLLLENNRTGTAAGRYLNGGSGGVAHVSSDNGRAELSMNTTSTLIIRNNKAANGGAFFLQGKIDAKLFSHSNDAAEKVLVISGNEAANAGGAFYVKTENGTASVHLGLRSDENVITGNKAALLPGASTETGGAFHIESENGEANLTLKRNSSGAASLTIQGNTVGTGAGQIQRAIYMKSGVTGATRSGSIQFVANNGSTIALHDEIKAVAAAGNTKGYEVEIQGSMTAGGTFSQIGQNARVFIPGTTTLTYGTHRLEGGARYQTYDDAGAPFGSYTLSANTTLAAKGTGNVLASEKYTFQVGGRGGSPSSTLGFDLTGATPGATTALLALAGGEVDTSNGGGLLGQNNVVLSGNVTAPGNYYLLNATTTTATGQTSPVNTTGGTLLTDSLTLNGNPVTPFSAVISRPTGGRIYATATLNTGTPGGTTGNKLYVNIANTDYNIVNSWTGQSDRNWKAELSTTGTGNWDGRMYVDDQGTMVSTNTFLNGDVVIFPKSTTTSGGTINVDPAGVIVGGMTMNAGGDITFLGGPITGRASSTKAHSSDAALIAQTNGTLLISDCQVTFTNTIDFAGNGTNAGIQVEPGQNAHGILGLGGAARLGANDDQNVNLTSGTNRGIVAFKQDADYTYKGTISGDGDLQKFENTTLTLAKNQTFTGKLSIQGGTVVLNGIDLAAGSVVVIPNATLAGDGIASAGGGANSMIMGTLSPGVGSGKTGKLTFGKANRDNVTLSPYAKLIVDIQGTKADLVEVGGDILIQNDNGTGATLELGTVAGFVPAKAEYVILSAIGGTITGVDPRNGNPAALPPDFDGSKTFTTANGIEFEVIHRTVNDPRRGTIDQIILYSPLGGGTATPAPVVPEPSTYALCGALGALALALHRHRRRNRNPNNRNKPHAS